MRLMDEQVKFTQIWVTDYAYYYSFKRGGFELALEPLIASNAEGMAVCIYDTESFSEPDLVGEKKRFWLEHGYSTEEFLEYFDLVIRHATLLYKQYMSQKHN